MSEAINISRHKGSGYRLRTNLIVWVIYSNENFQRHITNELNRSSSLTIETFSFKEINIGVSGQRNAPDLILIDTGEQWAKTILELQNIDLGIVSDSYEPTLVVLGDDSDSQALKLALRTGAADFISDKAELSDFFPILEGIAHEKISNRELGELLVFINTKGGSGASTLAMNTAVEMAHSNKGDVLLLDLDMQFGVTDEYLNISSPYSLVDAIDNVGDLDQESLGSFVTKHSSGLHVLGFQFGNIQDNYNKSLHIKKLLPLLREFYSYVVVDLSRGIDYVTSPVINPATRILLVTQQNLVAIKNVSRVLKLLTFEFAVSRDIVEVVVNRFESRQSIKLKDIQEAIGSTPVHAIPNDFKTALDSVNLGQPFVEGKKGSPLSKSIIKLANTVTSSEEPKKSWIKRLFS
ncbi:AAA family ATPase [Vibrio maerlii]|uniref:AAA family ATPase n=1 Tax=Vibrio maerlii TaxID=2231648 RepID=UPI000E3CD3B6|nr:AAA family ATPase [Vibrio maerlii]